MSRQIMSAAEIRAELARRRMTRKELAQVLGVSTDYVTRIARGERTAEARRAQITQYFAGMRMMQEAV